MAGCIVCGCTYDGPHDVDECARRECDAHTARMENGGCTPPPEDEPEPPPKDEPEPPPEDEPLEEYPQDFDTPSAEEEPPPPPPKKRKQEVQRKPAGAKAW
jgi:hypothetical protein